MMMKATIILDWFIGHDKAYVTVDGCDWHCSIAGCTSVKTAKARVRRLYFKATGLRLGRMVHTHDDGSWEYYEADMLRDA